jgi:hypothetical protein
VKFKTLLRYPNSAALTSISSLFRFKLQQEFTFSTQPPWRSVTDGFSAFGDASLNKIKIALGRDLCWRVTYTSVPATHLSKSCSGGF